MFKQVKQGPNESEMSILYHHTKVRNFHACTLDSNGLFRFLDKQGHPVRLSTPYKACLTLQKRKDLSKKIGRQLVGEKEESERVEAKNSFENTLREVLNNKVILHFLMPLHAN